MLLANLGRLTIAVSAERSQQKADRVKEVDPGRMTDREIAQAKLGRTLKVVSDTA
jgi:hypothetical protein